MAPKKASISNSWRGDVSEDERRVIIAALRTAINSYENDERTFRQVVEELQNGKDVPMFARGDIGIGAARKLADSSYVQAKNAKEVLAKWETTSDDDDGGGAAA